MADLPPPSNVLEGKIRCLCIFYKCILENDFWSSVEIRGNLDITTKWILNLKKLIKTEIASPKFGQTVMPAHGCLRGVDKN